MLFVPPYAIAFSPLSIADMPESITVRGRSVSLRNLKNPLPANNETLAKGLDVYFKNCFLCHGDHLDGRGVFSSSFYPPPANFRSPSSISSKPQSYAYWRIMKGGRALPKQFEPWNSAMPSWEDQLTEDEVWQVIYYLFKKIIENPSAGTSKYPSLERGLTVYLKQCAQCHGENADGKGVAAPYISPPPRNLTKSQFKLRTTPFGKLPTDQDMMDTLIRGLPNTAMPSWRHLVETDRLSLIKYLKSISRKFQRFIKKKKSHKVLQVPEPPPFSLESTKRGEELFLVNCSGCHGVKGKQDGTSTERIVDLATGAIWPRNLSKPWTFRRGASRKDLYLTLRTGLYGSAMPMFSKRITSDKNIWDIVHYVQTLGLSQKPPVNRTIKSRKVEAAIPMNPDDSFWGHQLSSFIPLGGQIITSEKLYFPKIKSLTVKSVHNRDEIAFQISWDDPRVDPVLIGNIPVKESPVPPIPKSFKGKIPAPIEDNEERSPQEIPDAIAIQFPVSNLGNVRPYFLNGDVNRQVNLWKWQTNYPFRVEEQNGNGIELISPQQESKQLASGKAIYEYGQYRLVMKRKLITSDNNDAQFFSGQSTSIAFNAWDGSSGETNSKMSISSWFNFLIE